MSESNTQLSVWLKRLSSPSKSTRQDAIRALEDIGIAEVLFPLASVFASDPDEDIRLLAQQAGQRIYHNLHRRANSQRSATQEERQQAADILAKAHSKKLKRR
jgi:HEAT repeat protein